MFYRPAEIFLERRVRAPGQGAAAYLQSGPGRGGRAKVIDIAVSEASETPLPSPPPPSSFFVFVYLESISVYNTPYAFFFELSFSLSFLIVWRL